MTIIGVHKRVRPHGADNATDLPYIVGRADKCYCIPLFQIPLDSEGYSCMCLLPGCVFLNVSPSRHSTPFFCPMLSLNLYTHIHLFCQNVSRCLLLKCCLTSSLSSILQTSHSSPLLPVMPPGILFLHLSLPILVPESSYSWIPTSVKDLLLL